MANNSPAPFRVALISMPWSIFNRPSIQLGALKSYLERSPEFKVDSFHPYLQTAKSISTELYNQITASGWAGEALFSPLLFPAKKDDARKLFTQSLKGTVAQLPDYNELVTKIDDDFNTWLSTVNIHQFDLIGFSVCFNQLLPSLYLAKKIKAAIQDISIVFGGSSCSGPLGESLIRHFLEIDYLIDGEGEEPLFQLCQCLAGKSKHLPGDLLTRDTAPTPDLPSPKLNVNDLPYPDYSSYFDEMRHLFPGAPFIPVLPVEFSRGCWWNKCTFCNLNLQWQDYRHKRGERMEEEIHHLAATHETLHFTFTDNALPPKEADVFFQAISDAGMDLDFFAEIRGITDPKRLQLYNRGGLNTVQVGIEALSSSLLKKMDKGTSVIDNIAVMKLCSQYSIRMEGNIITDFPTTTEDEISESLENLEYLLPFPPLQPATFFLGYGSPIHTCAKKFDIQTILTHPKNRRLFPSRYLRSMTMLINSYRGDRKLQQKLWRPVKKKMKQWQEFHSGRSNSKQHPLTYRDGKTFLIIRQERSSGAPLLHRLKGLSRRIYLSCETPVKIEVIEKNFPQVSGKALQKFIADMCAKRIMFEADGRVLSLAVRQN